MREREIRDRDCDETDRQTDYTQNMSGNSHRKVLTVTISGDAGKGETLLALFRLRYSLNFTTLLFFYKMCNENY